MLADLRLALRHLAKSPGFAAVAVLSLALGIGANTAVFSLVNAVLLQRLPVRNPEELIVFNWRADENVGPREGSSGWTQKDAVPGKYTSTSFSLATFEQLREPSTTLAHVFAFAPFGNLNVNVDGAAEILSGGQFVSGEYFNGVGVAPVVGRLIGPEDQAGGGQPVAVISARYWRNRFAVDPAVVGKGIRVNNVPVTIIGVTAEGFNGTLQVGEVADISLPLLFESQLNSRWDGRNPDFWWVRIMARMKSGVSREQARASVEGVFHGAVREHVRVRVQPGAPPVEPGKVPLPEFQAQPGGQGLYEARRIYQKSLNILIGVVGAVLLIACANVANLLLARGAARRREIALRLALGASRARIVGQLLAESVLLAALGAGAGIVVAVWGTRALLAMQVFGPGQSAELNASFDWRVLGFATVAALATGILFGLVPALRATRLNLSSEFQGGHRTIGGGARSTLAKSLMVVQVSLSLLLLVGAGLFVRTLRNLQEVEIGFNRERLLLFAVSARASVANAVQATAIYERMRERIAQIPGVVRAGFATIPPLSQSNWTSGVTVPGYVPTRNESVSTNGVDPMYLPTLEIPLLFGRNFTPADGPDAPKVAIVNQAFARKYFNTEDVVGRRIGFRGRDQINTEIVGIIRDAQYSGVKTAPPPTVLVSFSQSSDGDPTQANFVVRFNGDTGAIVAAVRSAVRDVDANLPLMNVRTQEQQIARLFSQERMFATLCSFFGVLALALATIGLYGLMSYAVVQRTGEIGLRMALGALPPRVLWMILRESMGLVVLGVVIGIATALGATRWIASLLFHLSPTDPTTYAVVAVLLMLVAAIACLIPARRAAKVDPMVALRME